MDSLRGPRRHIRILLNREKYLVITALLAVFIVLGILYESLIHPLTIISDTAVGQRWCQCWGRCCFTSLCYLDHRNHSADLDCETTCIMMIHSHCRRSGMMGKSTHDAIFEACMLRFRPIMMTTMAAIFGALPLAFCTGTGSECAAFWHYDRRWIAAEPIADALHHPGCVFGHGSDAPLRGGQIKWSAGTGGRIGK